MAEDHKKKIHIKDGNAEAEETKAAAEAEELKEEAEAKAEAEQAEAAESAEAAEEKAADGEAEEAGGKEESEAKEESDAKEEAKADEKDAEAEESERYMRLMAEFQNFKRRAAREKSDIHAYANERIVSDLLPVLDNFERALNTETDEFEAYAKGMELIFEQLKTALEKAGVKEIEALGCDFDPNVHNAVMTDNTDDYENDKISKVLQKGYKLNDKVVRPSMVAVNKK
ncbi:MAG: nucleotide exchange factor GrpE [Mogibacterium sp.]|nr:nucleotide exchange factor GrpE [Mogibacterium sp.]